MARFGIERTEKVEAGTKQNSMIVIRFRSRKARTPSLVSIALPYPYPSIT